MLLIQNAIIHTMEEKSLPPFTADVLIHKGMITQITKTIEPTADMCVINGSGKHLFPGFIDAHSHIGISEEKIGGVGDDCNEMTNPITPQLRAIDAINPLDSAFHNALAVGITSVMAGPGSSNAVGGQFVFMKTYGRRIEDQLVMEPAAMKVAFGENPKMNYGSNDKMPGTRMAIAALIREELFQARKYLEKANLPEDEDFRWECYRPVFEQRIPLKAHVHRTDDIFTAIRIAKEFDIRITLDHCTEGHLIAEEIAESGFPAIVGPNLASRSKNEVSMSDFKTAGILRKAGVTIALTTDHPVSRIQYLPICAGLAAKEGLGEENALRSITIDAARICGVDERVGSIREGKDADLILYDGNPLTLEAKLVMTIVGGEIAWPVHPLPNTFIQ